MKETAIIRGLKRNNPKAQEVFFKEVYPITLRVITKMVKCETTAENLAIQSIETACRKIGKFKQQSKLSSWVYMIAKREALIYLRWQRTRKETLIDPANPIFTKIPDPAELPDPILRRGIAKQLARLSDLEQKIILETATKSDGDNARLAEQWGLSEPGYKSRVLRARVKYRKLLGANL